MRRFRVRAEDEAATLRIARALGRAARPGAVFALIAELGGGKTRFVKGLAEGLGIDMERVASPTFVVVTEYLGRARLVHMDWYRLTTVREAEAMGLAEYFDGSAICAVEWADRLPELVPAGATSVRIEIVDSSRRLIEMQFENEAEEVYISALENEALEEVRV